ncbi:hypothetical protein ACFLZB_00965 [Nanoarchaeota archaeon]
MNKKDVIIIAAELLVIIFFFSLFYFNNKIVGASFLLPGTTHFENCWNECDDCDTPCLEECCFNDLECFEDVQIMCPEPEVIGNG